MRESLIDLRKALDWRQSDLARAAGVSQTAISQIERGRGRPEVEETLRATLFLEQARRREAAQDAEAARRIEALAGAMPESPEWTALRAALKERALDYLERGEPVACDALLEILPVAEASDWLTAYLEPDAAPAPTPDAASPPEDEPPMTAAPPTATTPTDASGADALADRIDRFVERYARIRRSYVPGEDDPEDRFNGPDTAMMASAAVHIRAGRRPHLVHSDWASSGCYRIPEDEAERQAASDEHTALVVAINALARGA